MKKIQLPGNLLRLFFLVLWLGTWAIAALGFRGSMIIPVMKIHRHGITAQGRIVELTHSYSSIHVGSSTAYPNDVLVFRFRDVHGVRHEVRHFISDAYLPVVREKIERQVDADGGSALRIAVQYLPLQPEKAMPEEDIYVRKWAFFWFIVFFFAGVCCLYQLVKTKVQP